MCAQISRSLPCPRPQKTNSQDCLNGERRLETSRNLFNKILALRFQPCGDCPVHLGKMSCEEMIGAWNNYDTALLFRAWRKFLDYGLQLLRRPIRIEFPRLPTGRPSPISSATRESLQPARRPTHEPKLNPASKSGAPGYFDAKKSSAAETSSCSPRPSSCAPSLKPVPRKLKRRTGRPKRCSVFATW